VDRDKRIAALALALGSVQGAQDRLPDEPEHGLDQLADETGTDKSVWFGAYIGLADLADVLRASLIELAPCRYCLGKRGFEAWFGYGEREYHECWACSGKGYELAD
jgi:hypothetical protein